MTPIVNRTIFLSDNLPILRDIDSDSIDLIATDPPFNKGVGAFEGKTKEGRSLSYKDVWSWDDDVLPEWRESISKEHPALYLSIKAANGTAGKDMGAYLCWMTIRALEMHRILKPTGSIYLHCDQTASHYLKAMMDGIFGRENFRNEIVWHYGLGGFNVKHWFPRKHDVILYYAKSSSSHHNKIRGNVTDSMKSRYSQEDENGKYFVHNDVKYYLKGGKPIDSVWDNDDLIEHTMSQSSGERMGYPTQKPVAVYKRMIEASSNPGDIVLDPFAGSATTCVAAERLGRQWIGIDVNEQAIDVIRQRLQSEVNASMDWSAGVRVLTEL